MYIDNIQTYIHNQNYYSYNIYVIPNILGVGNWRYYPTLV